MKDPIVQTGAPVLRQIAKPVDKKDIGSRAFKMLISKMSKALETEDFGVAIAAPQVGESLRVFVVAGKVFKKETDEFDGQDRVFINPKLLRVSKKKEEKTEGCLSVRHKYGSVMRHTKATVEAQDIDGKKFTLNGSGLLAQIFQHEIDHLNGILYTDKAVTLEDDEDWKELKEKRANRGKVRP